MTLKLMGSLTIPNDSFVRTAPTYNPNLPKRAPSEAILNPQTAVLCEKLGIDDPLQVVLARSGRRMKQVVMIENSESIEINDQSQKIPIKCSPLSLPAPVTPSPSENLSETVSSYSQSISFLSENEISETTPQTNRKVFKRRNISMYTSEGETSSNTSGSQVDSDSPKSSKLACHNNLLYMKN